MEWSKNQYNKQYESWVPWAEDKYLYWMGKDNKASYATKGMRAPCCKCFTKANNHTDAMDKSKVTGIDQVDRVQDSVNGAVSGQVGQGGLLQPVGDMASKEGINRAERGGKDDKGSVTGTSVGDSVANTASSGGSSLANGASSAAGTASDGAKGAGSYIGSLVS